MDTITSALNELNDDLKGFPAKGKLAAFTAVTRHMAQHPSDYWEGVAALGRQTAIKWLKINPPLVTEKTIVTIGSWGHIKDVQILAKAARWRRKEKTVLQQGCTMFGEYSFTEIVQFWEAPSGAKVAVEVVARS